jgi:hypothetical protein
LIFPFFSFNSFWLAHVHLHFEIQIINKIPFAMKYSKNGKHVSDCHHETTRSLVHDKQTYSIGLAKTEQTIFHMNL